MQKACDRCGKINVVVANFCRHCGKPWTECMIRSATKVSPLMMQWRALKRSMTRQETRTLLGEPLTIEMTAPSKTPASERWVYEYEIIDGQGERLSGHVEFLASEGTLSGWTEPDWSALIP